MPAFPRFAPREKRYLPEAFYNIKADLPEPPPPALHPGTRLPLTATDWAPVFFKGFIEHEMSRERFVPIPEEVLRAMAIFRPTPLVYAAGLRDALGTPAHIFYKYEGAGPTGSRKSNTALVQAYLASQDGLTTLVTETGAGQWGSALAHAGSLFSVKVKVFMVRVSYRQKPGRRTLMEMFSAEVDESPSPKTRFGRTLYEKDPDHPGSLGIAISEALEMALEGTNCRYSLGSVLDAVLMHQTVIGREAELQMAYYGISPDTVIGCVGGGSNFGGLAFPFVRRRLAGGPPTRFVAVEPEACPSLTKGELRYDHGDTAGMTPLVYMHTLGMDFVPPPIHAGGLRIMAWRRSSATSRQRASSRPRRWIRIKSSTRPGCFTRPRVSCPPRNRHMPSPPSSSRRSKPSGSARKRTDVIFVRMVFRSFVWPTLRP
jgi:tryptophan synthase beta chain